MNPNLDLMPGLSHLHIFISSSQLAIFIWMYTSHVKSNKNETEFLIPAYLKFLLKIVKSWQSLWKTPIQWTSDCSTCHWIASDDSFVSKTLQNLLQNAHLAVSTNPKLLCTICIARPACNQTLNVRNTWTRLSPTQEMLLRLSQGDDLPGVS